MKRVILSNDFATYTTVRSVPFGVKWQRKWSTNDVKLSSQNIDHALLRRGGLSLSPRSPPPRDFAVIVHIGATNQMPPNCISCSRSSRRCAASKKSDPPISEILLLVPLKPWHDNDTIEK